MKFNAVQPVNEHGYQYFANDKPQLSDSVSADTEIIRYTRQVCFAVEDRLNYSNPPSETPILND